MIKLTPNLAVADYFTPYNVAFLNSNDLDLSSTGALILPDQPGATPHQLVASGKQGFVYVLDRDLMGFYQPNDAGALQEFALIPGETQTTVKDVEFGSPAYWNNTVYYAPDGTPVEAFQLSGGLFGNPPGTANFKTAQPYQGAHSPSISANGNTSGVLWVIPGQLLAFDAGSLKLLYGSNQAHGSRDTLPPVGHFVTQTVINGKVYVGTQNSLVAYGLFQALNLTGGGAQTAPVGTTLPAPIQVQAVNPYTAQPVVGVTVNFSDGCNKPGATWCGTFNPTSAVTDSNGNVSTTYTVPKKAGTYTLTASATGFGNATTTATAAPSGVIKIIAYGGNGQTGPAGSKLPKPLVVQAQDASNNGVPGVTINFTANNGGVVSSPSVVTGANGLASIYLTLPTTVAKVTVTASSTGLKSILFVEYSVAGPAANIAITSGNNQTASAGTQLPQALTVLVTDQYGNPVSGNNVTFTDNGAGGSFSNSNPVVTGSNGTATQSYTLPASPGTVTINATAAGVANPAIFTETGQ